MHNIDKMLLKPGYKLQSIIFNKAMFTKNAVVKWLNSHQYKSNKIDIAPHYYRARQLDPDYLFKQGYTEFRTLTIDPKNDIKIIIGYKPTYMRKP